MASPPLRRDRALFDVYRCDLATGKLALDTRNPGDVVGWAAEVRERSYYGA